MLPSLLFWNPLDHQLWFACESRENGKFSTGNSILHEKDFNNHRDCEIIKILGVYFGYDEKQRNDLNFRQTLKSIKKSINMWKWRNLSLLGKIQIIKTFAIPKLMFRASVIPISNDLVKEANSIFYNFI